MRRETPWRILRNDWKAIFGKVWSESGRDNLSLIAAGTAFWGFAAIAPLLGAVVLSYGLFASSATVVANVEALFGVLPREAATLIADQLTNVVETSDGKKGLGLLVALALALYGATKGASALIGALNVAYEEQESRGFVRLTVLAFAITAAAVSLGIAAAIAATLPAVLKDVWPALPGIAVAVLRLLTFGVLAGLAITAAAMLYRFGPDRRHAKWIWLTPGSLAATGLWLASTVCLSLYVTYFAGYGATYGSLSAVIVLQLWLWLTIYVFLLGAELNSEIERRAQTDTTIGPTFPPGQRGATVADASPDN